MGKLHNRELIGLLKKLRENIEKEFSLERMILFGSRAKDEWLLTSDVDLILVSRDFHGIPFRHRMKRIIEFWDEDVGLTALCYTPAEFEEMKSQIGIVSQALREGVEIKS